MTTAANRKCILCARHVDSAVLTAISRPPLLPSQFVDVEAEALQTCLRSHRLALPRPHMVGEMTWAPARPRGIGTCSLHTPPSSRATDTRQHCVLANLHKRMRTPPHTLDQQSSNMQMSRTGPIGHMHVQLHGFMTYTCRCKLHITFLKRSILYFYSLVPPTPAMGSPHFTPRHTHSPAYPLPFLHPQHLHLGTLSSPRSGSLCFSPSHRIPPRASSPFVHSLTQNVLVCTIAHLNAAHPNLNEL